MAPELSAATWRRCATPPDTTCAQPRAKSDGAIVRVWDVSSPCHLSWGAPRISLAHFAACVAQEERVAKCEAAKYGFRALAAHAGQLVDRGGHCAMKSRSASLRPNFAL